MPDERRGSAGKDHASFANYATRYRLRKGASRGGVEDSLCEDNQHFVLVIIICGTSSRPHLATTIVAWPLKLW